jgi:hypothetical protein
MRRSPGGPITKAERAKTEREVVESLTDSYTDIMREKLAADPLLRDAFRQEIATCLREGDLESARGMLRDYFDEDLVTDQPETTAAAL